MICLCMLSAYYFDSGIFSVYLDRVWPEERLVSASDRFSPSICELTILINCWLCRPRLTAAMKHDVLRPLFCSSGGVTAPVVRYIGRPTSASTATAAFLIHSKELEGIIDECLQVDHWGHLVSDTCTLADWLCVQSLRFLICRIMLFLFCHVVGSTVVPSFSINPCLLSGFRLWQFLYCQPALS